MKRIFKKKHIALALSVFLFLSLGAYFVLPDFFGFKYVAESNYEKPVPTTVKDTEQIEQADEVPPVLSPEDLIVVTHLDTPISLKAVYMSSWVAGSKSIRNNIIAMVKRTELNAVVIDVKDYTGRLSFPVTDPLLVSVGSAEKRIPDIKSFIKELHDNNIYAIARIATFQDPYLAKKWRDVAVTKLSDKTALWQDDKCKRQIAKGKEGACTYWLDAGSQKVWDYAVAIGRESYAMGFDELNFDYIRFPADGNMKDIYFPVSEGKVKREVMRDFFKYLHDEIAGAQNEITPRPKLSADFFGMVMTNTDDLNIGQQLEMDIPYFDYIAPMVYPSHFPTGWNGFAKPATVPYEVVKIAMEKGVARLKVINEDPNKLRPWLQDFNLGATYTADLVRAQMKATYDDGLTSWMLWDPANTYTESALLVN